MTEFTRTFDESWPSVLTSMHVWLRTQVALTGGNARYRVCIRLSAARLMKIPRETIRPALDNFEHAIREEFGLDKKAVKRLLEPQQEQHSVSFSYHR